MRLTIDQSHNIEPKVEAHDPERAEPPGGLRQGAARRPRRARAGAARGRRARCATASCSTPSRPTCARFAPRCALDLGAAEDPIAAFRAGGYAAAAAESRAGGAGRMAMTILTFYGSPSTMAVTASTSIESRWDPPLAPAPTSSTRSSTARTCSPRTARSSTSAAATPPSRFARPTTPGARRRCCGSRARAATSRRSMREWLRRS